MFDRSAKYKNTSLNDQILSGPDTNNKLVNVLLGFRDGSTSVSGDIKSVFHSFHLKSDKRDFTKFFWFKDYEGNQNELSELGLDVLGLITCKSRSENCVNLKYIFRCK